MDNRYFFRRIFDWFTRPRNHRINALDFEQKLSAVEDSFHTSENFSQCNESLKILKKLHRRLPRKDHQSFINRINSLQATLHSKRSFDTPLSRSYSNINIEYNDEIDRLRHETYSRSTENINQEPLYELVEYYYEDVPCSSTVIDLETADGPTNAAIAENIEDYNQKTYAAQSKQELNVNTENKTNNSRITIYRGAVRIDYLQKRLPETNQDQTTEPERKQIMTSTYQACSSRTNENEISSASERHQNCYNFDQDPREVVQSIRQHPDEYQRHVERNLGHSQSRGYASGKIEQFTALARVENDNYERSKSATAQGKTSCNNLEDSDNFAQVDVSIMAQQLERERHRPEIEELLRQIERIEEEDRRQQQQKFGYHHEEDQRQREEEEEEEALQEAQQRHQRELEHERQRPEEEELLQQNDRIEEEERQQQQHISDQFIDDSIKNYLNKDLDDNLLIDDLILDDPRRVTQTFNHYINNYDKYQRQYQEREKLLQHKRLIVRIKEEQQQFRDYDEEYQRQRDEEEKAFQEAQQRYQRHIEEQKIKEKERQQQQQTEKINKTEIVDISDKFIDDSIKKYPNKNNLEYFKLIRNKAKSLENDIEQFESDDYCIEYFNLYDNLLQLIEIMDKIRCEKDKNLFPHKIEIIKYIRQLIANLDARNQS